MGMHPLKAERKRHHLTQVVVAELLGLSTSTIERAERGEPINGYSSRLISDFFKKSADELGLIYRGDKPQEKPSPQFEGDDVNRKQALQVIGAAGASVILGNIDAPLYERLGRAFSKPMSISDFELATFENVTESFWNLRTSVGYVGLISAYKGHIETLTEQLQRSHPQIIYKRLCMIASDTAQKMGAAYFDVQDFVSAQGYYTVALQAANAAGNPVLSTMALGRMSSLHLYSKSPKKALVCIDEAIAFGGSSVRATTRAWLHSLKAESLSLVGEKNETIRALMNAERELTTSADVAENNRYEIQFDHSRFIGYKGACFLNLQEPHLALDALSEALNSDHKISTRQESIILGDMAIACSKLKEIEEGCAIMKKALIKTAQTRSEIVVERVRQFRQNIDFAKESRTVKEFDELLNGYMIA